MPAGSNDLNSPQYMLWFRYQNVIDGIFRERPHIQETHCCDVLQNPRSQAYNNVGKLDLRMSCESSQKPLSVAIFMVLISIL